MSFGSGIFENVSVFLFSHFACEMILIPESKKRMGIKETFRCMVIGCWCVHWLYQLSVWIRIAVPNDMWGAISPSQSVELHTSKFNIRHRTLALASLKAARVSQISVKLQYLWVFWIEGKRNGWEWKREMENEWMEEMKRIWLWQAAYSSVSNGRQSGHTQRLKFERHCVSVCVCQCSCSQMTDCRHIHHQIYGSFETTFGLCQWFWYWFQTSSSKLSNYCLYPN